MNADVPLSFASDADRDEKPSCERAVAFDHDSVTVAPQDRPLAELIDTARDSGQHADSADSLVEVVGDYEIIREVARGGMGVVYLAKHRHLARQVALKMMLVDCTQYSSASDRFALEAEAVARLDHPGIVTVYEVGEHQGKPFIAMKYIGGGCLSDSLREGPLACRRALELGIEVSAAVAHAHERGVIHRDLKPANILLDQDGRAVITDFGIAKFVEKARCHLTTIGEPIGTPHYMPPEQADASRGTVNPASDVYSIGAVIYAMITGRPPFQAASAIDVMMQVLSSDPVPPRRLNSTVPVALDAVVMRCLRKDAKQRYQTAAELEQDLCCTLKHVNTRYFGQIPITDVSQYVRLNEGKW
jgi:eukaryotic-like serine/threonine-protein kinase